ncbi:MAG: tetratricopeptide repeat protein [Capsulimonadaceae bacterium]|nr:tetratricopeptide repeat protein [Capsulimonadaceae bacterium]
MAIPPNITVPDAASNGGVMQEAKAGPRPWLLALLLIALVIAVYHNVPSYDFVTWDDPIHVSANPYVSSPSLSNVQRLWRAPYEGLYIPVTYTFIAVIGQIAPLSAPAMTDHGTMNLLNPRTFHIANIVLACVNALLVFVLLRRIVKHDPAACGGALLFAIHPLQVESVAWISEMRGLLGGMFALVALLAYLRHVDLLQDRGNKWAWAWYLGATAAFALSLLSKPSYAALPLVALALDRCHARRSWQPVIASTAPWFAMVCVCVLLTTSAQLVVPSAVTRVWQRLFVAGDAFAFYLGKLIWPANLTIDYGRTPGFVLRHAWGYVEWLIPALVVAVAWRRRMSSPDVWLGIVIFVAMLLPVSGIVPFAYQSHSTVADRYVYFAMLGVCVIVAHILSVADRRAWAFYAVLLIALATLTFGQQKVWRNSLMLYRHAVAVNAQSSSMHMNLGTALVDAGLFDDGLQQFTEALRYDPRNAMAQTYVGLIFLRRGDIADAVNAIRLAVADQPGIAIPHCRLGYVLFLQHKDLDALREFERAASIEPDMMDAHRGMAAIFEAHHKAIFEIAELRQIVRLSPADPNGHIQLGHALEKAGFRSGARVEYTRALALAPGLTWLRDKLQDPR